VVHDIGLPAGVEAPARGPGGADADLDLLRRRLGNVLGHALRTPVATVRGLVGSIEPTGEDVVVHREVLTALHRSAARLEELVDDLLLVSGIETVLPTGAAQPLAPVEVAREVAADLDRPLGLETHGDLDATVEVPPDLLRWMLRAVLDNAARYGSGDARLDVAAGPDRLRVTVTTRSAGAGATDHDLDHALEPFYRGEKAVLADGARLGVGLTVAARLADEVGGRISVRRGEGETFVTDLELPSP
jgi:two-component system, OmpR family, phosphate regulon sensor histidine kinase PhoR